MEINTTKIIKYLIISIIAVVLLFGSFGTVGAGERGVRTQLGRVLGIVDQGLYLKIPFIQKVHKISVRTQSVSYEKENPLTAASKDLQDVQVANVVTYHVDPTKVIDLFVQYENLAIHEDKVVKPMIRDTVKSVASQYTAEELVTKRSEFSQISLSKLNDKLAGSFVIVEQSNITNLQFSPSFSQAIEAKVTAVQNAEAQKNKLEQIKYEAEQTIVTAKATAEAQRISSQALAAQGGADYVNLKAIEKWNGVLPEQMIPNATVPFINLNK